MGDHLAMTDFHLDDLSELLVLVLLYTKRN